MATKPIEFRGAGRTDAAPNWMMKNHHHDFHEMIVVYAGRMFVEIAGRDLVGEQGDVLFYPRGVAHEERSDPNDPVETIFVSWQGDVGKYDFIAHDAHGRIRMLARWLYEERLSSFATAVMIKGAFLQAMLAEFVKLSTTQEHSTLVQTIRSYIQDHLAERLTLDELAVQAKMSKFHFVRRYKRSAGRTPMEDVRVIRVEAARDLVITTDLPLKSIAAKVGLGNEYYLSRSFRRVLNVPPGYFRKTAFRTFSD